MQRISKMWMNLMEFFAIPSSMTERMKMHRKKISGGKSAENYAKVRKWFSWHLETCHALNESQNIISKCFRNRWRSTTKLCSHVHSISTIKWRWWKTTEETYEFIHLPSKSLGKLKVFKQMAPVSVAGSIFSNRINFGQIQCILDTMAEKIEKTEIEG